MSERPMTASLISSLPLFSLLILFSVIDLSAELASKCEFICREKLKNSLDLSPSLSFCSVMIFDLSERAHKFKTFQSQLALGVIFFFP